MKTYTITINEEQRAALLELLRKANRGGDDNDDPLHLWVGMLEDLPDLEAKEPGIVHGFCY